MSMNRFAMTAVAAFMSAAPLIPIAETEKPDKPPIITKENVPPLVPGPVPIVHGPGPIVSYECVQETRDDVSDLAEAVQTRRISCFGS